MAAFPALRAATESSLFSIICFIIPLAKSDTRLQRPMFIGASARSLYASSSAELSSTAALMSVNAEPYAALRFLLALTHFMKSASFCSSRPMMFRFAKAFFWPIHFFQPFDEPAYLFAYLRRTAGAASMPSIMMFCLNVLAAMLTSCFLIICSSIDAVWNLWVRPGYPITIAKSPSPTPLRDTFNDCFGVIGTLSAE